MAKRSKAASLPRPVPAVERLFRQFTVAAGESASEYESLAQGIVHDLQPHEMVETIFARDVVDHTWEVQRLRRIEAALLSGEVEPIEHEQWSPQARAQL